MLELNKILNTVLCGDTLNVLKTFPDNTFNCCMTSPPYYGLRDYGTATWEGGDSNCNHQIGRNTRGGLTEKQFSNKSSFDDEAIKTGQLCPKCGAKRIDKQIGLEETPELYIEKLVEIFREVKKVLRKDGTLWIVIGDTYWSSGGASRHHGYTDPKYKNGRKIEYFEPQCYPHKLIKRKDLIGIPWMLAFALRADGWWLRSDIIWNKNAMPEAVKDRPTKSHEYIFLLSKSAKYYYDYKSILEVATGYDGRKDTFFKGSKKYKDSGYTFHGRGYERWPNKITGNTGDGHSGYFDAEEKPRFYTVNNIPARNKRSVWNVNTESYSGAHFAIFPQRLIWPCIKAGCPEGGIILDPFAGTNTTGIVARKQNKNFISIELNPDYIKLAEQRMNEELGIWK